MVDLTDAELDALEVHNQAHRDEGNEWTCEFMTVDEIGRLIAEVRRWREKCCPCDADSVDASCPAHAPVTAPGAASGPKEAGDE